TTNAANVAPIRRPTVAAPSDKAITPVPEPSAVTVVQRACDQPEIALPIVLCHRYQCLAKLGGGGMAQVFQAYDPHLDRPVAVKIINPRLRADQEFDSR